MACGSANRQLFQASGLYSTWQKSVKVLALPVLAKLRSVPLPRRPGKRYGRRFLP
jgi:hypothetical protein